MHKLTVAEYIAGFEKDLKSGLCRECPAVYFWYRHMISCMLMGYR